MTPPVPPVPDAQCDVVMKGGITSGVIYPLALETLARTYRIRSIGGASAGAIGAAMGAAAEFGRATGGFDRLARVPEKLGGGRMAALFQPQPETKQLLPLMLIATGNDRPGRPRSTAGKCLAIVRSLFTSFPLASLLGAAPGVALAVAGPLAGGWAGWLLVAAGGIVAVLGWVVLMALRLVRKATVDAPGNLFGICRGLGADAAHHGFTDWLADEIDLIAGVPTGGAPLTFGQLWSGDMGGTPDPAGGRQIDLRMITTCLSEGMPYEMPWQARRFFFDPQEWRRLFSERVVAALERAPLADDASDESRWEEAVASSHEPALRRLPDARHLPVAVATRLSLSFPLLISAVPLWTIDRRSSATSEAIEQYQAATKAGRPPPVSGLRFSKVWFTDGGFCSNFPVHLFDAALPERPTFAINLGRFAKGWVPDPDQRRNVEWARTNRSGLLPQFADIPSRGFGAIAGFASAAINTSRNWQDTSHLDQPGYRDRIVRVLQTKAEGGLNLYMETDTISGLADRGRTAATVMVEQFTQPQYPAESPTATGWDNHRWVRYRALLAVLPEWLDAYRQGRAVLQVDPASPPAYRFKRVAERQLADDLASKLDDLAGVIAGADPSTVDGLMSAPNPKGTLRRVPQI